MAATVGAFQTMLAMMGSDVTYHREEGGVLCPCLSPEGFRSPAWHKANPAEPVCNERGVLASNVIDLTVKASIQPVRLSRRRGAVDRATELFGEVQQGDHMGFFPVEWQGTKLDFFDWSEAGEDYIVYDSRRFIVVSADKLADVDGDPDHHWEVALRLLKPEMQRLV